MKILSIAAGAAICKDGKVLLTKRVATKDRFPNAWTFPAGRYDEEDGSLEKTAIREVKEEVNLDFKPLKKLNFYEYAGKDILSISHVFLGDWNGKLVFQREEISEIGWFTYDETKDLEIAFSYHEAIKDLHDLGLLK